MSQAYSRSENSTKLWKNIAIFVFITCLSTLVFWITPISKPKLNIELESSTNSISQLFLSTDNSYTESNSVTRKITLGDDFIKFPFDGKSPVRFDPLQNSGIIKIKNAYIEIFRLDFPLNGEAFTPLNQIQSLTSNGKATEIVTNTNANDAQIEIKFDDSKIYKARLFISLLAGSIVAIIFITIIAFRNTSNNLFSKLENSVSNTLLDLHNKRVTWQEIGYLFIIATVCNGYFLSVYSPSIDDEMGALRNNPEVWIGQGRWFVYLVERFLFPQPAIPFAPFILLCACLAISYAFITKLHDLRESWKTFICFPVFCSYPVWWFISEFYSNIPSLALGFLFTTFAVYLTFRHYSLDKKLSIPSIKSSLLTAVLLASAIGAYQSLILLYLTLGLGIIITKIAQSDQSFNIPVTKIFLKLLHVALTGSAGVVLYGIINYFAQALSGVHSEYLNNFLDLNKLITSPLVVIDSVFTEQVKIFTGSKSIFGASAATAALLLFGSSLTLLRSPKPARTVSLFILWGLLLTTPFLMHFLSGSNGMPMRTMITLSYVTWLMAILIVSEKTKTLSILGSIVVMIYVLQIFGVTSQYIASATITQSHDRLLAADIYRRIAEIDSNFDRENTIEIDVYGHKEVASPYATGATSTIQASFFDWDGGNLTRMTSYMKLMGYPNIKMVNPQNRKLLTPIFQKMPVWPAKGSVIKVDDRYLIRLSKNPDPDHMKTDN